MIQSSAKTSRQEEFDNFQQELNRLLIKYQVDLDIIETKTDSRIEVFFNPQQITENTIKPSAYFPLNFTRYIQLYESETITENDKTYILSNEPIQ